MKELREEWFGNAKGDLLAGIVVCMALIPEVIGFTIVAGVDPMIGIYSSFCISIIISIFGGRPGMISAAAGSMALVLASLVRDYGVQYMLAATILTGIIQVILGALRIGNLVKLIPEAVMHGFVNSLGILMFTSQIKHFKGNYILLVLGIISIVIIFGFPKITKVIPSPIVSIIVISLIVYIFKINIKTLGQLGKITASFPRFLVPRIPVNLETLKIILPYAVSLSIVGLTESLLTAQLVDKLTETKSNKNREAAGQGLSNIVAGFFGGIAGCGMIGQTITNQTYGGRGRLSTFLAGTYMLLVIIVFNSVVVKIPVVALASVMVVVAYETINWKSIISIPTAAFEDTLVMIVTVIIVLKTNNLAYGVVIGSFLSYFFGKMKIRS